MGAVVIAAGGTGGHLYPALAVARELQVAAPHIRVAFAGSAAGLEAGVVPAAGYEFVPLASGPWRRGHPMSLVAGAAQAARGAWQARALYRRLGARALFSTGGFASAPAHLAAALGGLPVVLHEPNAVPGVVTRLFARGAHRVTLGRAEAAPRLGGAPVLVTGVPVRAEIRGWDRARARAALGLPSQATVILALGGSRGAGGLNRALAAALPALGSLPHGTRLLWLCGRAEEAALAPVAAAAPVAVDLRGYLDDMGAALAAADFAVCRAGAGTLAELAAAALPALLVPFPHAADGHQALNAAGVAAAGAARVLPEAGLDGSVLAAAIAWLAGDEAARAAMSRAAGSLDRPDAAARIAGEILAAMGPGAEA